MTYKKIVCNACQVGTHQNCNDDDGVCECGVCYPPKDRYHWKLLIGNSGYFIVEGSPGKYDYICGPMSGRDAKLIVHRVNSYDDLVKACKRVLSFLKGNEDFTKDQAKNMLSKATEHCLT